MTTKKALHLFVTAVFLLNQAVFLLVPLDQIIAQDSGATSGSSTIIFPGSTTSTDTGTHYILMLDFISPPAKVSGTSYFSVKVSEEADVNFQIFYNGTILNQFIGAYQATDLLNNKIYYFKWPTLENANGNYTVKASAKKSGYIEISKQIYVIVENYQTANTTTATSSTANTTTATTNLISPINTTTSTSANLIATSTYSTNNNYATNFFEITFVEAYQPPFYGDKKITVSLNQEVENVNFSVVGVKNENVAGIKIDAKTYYFIWHTSDFPDSYYKVTADAMSGGVVKASKFFSAQTENKTLTNTTTTTATTNTTTTANDLIVQPLIVKVVEKLISPISGDYKVTAVTNKKVSKVDFVTSGPLNEKYSGIKIDDFQFYFVWPTAKFPNGFYSLSISAYNESETANWRNSVDIKNWVAAEVKQPITTVPIEIKPIIVNQEQTVVDGANVIMPECRQAGVITAEECKKYLSLSWECRNNGIKTVEECSKYLSIAPECRDRVLSKEECDKYLAVSPECRKQGILDIEQCKKLMYKNVMPIECQKAGAKTQEECSKTILANSFPIECQKAGVKSKEECDKVMFMKNSPLECRQANITNPDECAKHMEQITLPSECASAGIATKDACNKFMFEKFGDKNISSGNLPAECQKAGVKSGEECDKLMKKMFMPKECQDQGITDEAECSAYKESKHMTQECRDAGAKSQSECNKIMFNKYGPQECRDAGITDEKECNNFIFNKYAPQVQCGNIGDWQCKNSLQTTHLGDIVSKQTQYSELKEKIMPMAGESMTVQKINDELQTAKEIIPFKDVNATLKIVATKEQMVLYESDNLTQTSPVAVMIDSDGDGLPDDMEKRMGTDPNKSDSDSDGYSDSAEVKNKYNPIGNGEVKMAMAPIDEAILQNKTLAQPKTDGEESNKLTVNKIINMPADEKSKGYVVSGKAEPNSVVTLYVYSDLPLIATAKVDEYGNWQYELSKSLNDGSHEIYVAVNDNTGKVLTKSKPLSFFIKEAKAVSLKDFAASAPRTQTQKTESMLKYYIYVSILIIAIGITLFVSYHLQRRKEWGK